MYQRALRSDELMHHGILGQKWGVRRFQNPDGTLTAAGRRKIAKNTIIPKAISIKTEVKRPELK